MNKSSWDRISYDQSNNKKPLRLSTLLNNHIKVECLMSLSFIGCLVTIVSVESFFKYSTEGMTTNMDPMRLAAQIVSGVGFLGAGVILRRNNDVISGLTTAAMIWAASSDK